METPPEISFRHTDPSDEERAYIMDRIDKLNRFCDHITSCSVSLDREQRKADTGDFHRARVRVHVPPNHEIIGEHNPTDSKRQVDLSGAVTDAFDNAERQLRRLNKKQNQKNRPGPGIPPQKP